MKEFYYINLNPLRKRTGDCVVRAFAFFFCLPWRKAFQELIDFSADRGQVNFNYRSTYGTYLREKGYQRIKPPIKMSVGEFCENVAMDGYMYIVQVKRHLTIVNDRDVFDIWDCRDREVECYWGRKKPTI